MPYARVVLGLPLEGPFDYSLSQEISQKAKPGCRALVSFGSRKLTGYIIELTDKTKVKNIKEVIRLIDDKPILNQNQLLLTKKISDYYCASWGQVIESSLPVLLRKGKPIDIAQSAAANQGTGKITLAHFEGKDNRWQTYYPEKIKQTLSANKSVIILISDLEKISGIELDLKEKLNCSLTVLMRKDKQELTAWQEIKESKVKIALGSRSAVFAPFSDLGLIIMDEEQSYGYKQDQAPHYHARIAAITRSQIENADLILGSSIPSLESMHLAKEGIIQYEHLLSSQPKPEVKIIDMKGLPLISPKKHVILSKYLQDAISHALHNQEKILIFLNRRGYATTASCATCGFTLKCPRCNLNLVLYYKENILRCHHCNFKITPPKICPSCNKGYIHYSGAGTEKIESELARIFPQAKITLLDTDNKQGMSGGGIFISTQKALNSQDNFDLTVILAIDSSLNHAELSSAERTFEILWALNKITLKKMVIQTGLSQHYIFEALNKADSRIFYDRELKQRKELKLPPFTHIGIVKIRAKIEDKAEAAANKLFAQLESAKNKKVKIISLNKHSPYKLRGNYYWRILLSAKSALDISGFLKSQFKDCRYSGIITTVDIDPV